MSRLPFEQMIASLWSVEAEPKSGMNGAVWVVVMVSSSWWSDAAVRLGKARDVRELLGRLLREQHEQLLGGDAADRADPAQRGGGDTNPGEQQQAGRTPRE